MNDEAKTNNEDMVDEVEDVFGVAELDQALADAPLKGMARMPLALNLAAMFIAASWAFFTYWHSLPMGFVYDDVESIVREPAMHAITTVSEAWTDETSPSPLTSFTYAMDWKRGGGDPRPFHATNLALHMLNAALVYIVSRRLLGASSTPAVCLSGALLFAAHPVIADSVYYIANRHALLSTAALLAMLAAVLPGSGDTPVRGRYTSAVVAVVAFTLAWMSSVELWTAPIIAVIAVLCAATPWKHLRWTVAPLLALGLCFVAAHSAAAAARGEPIEVLAHLQARLALFPQYAILIVWPAPAALPHEASGSLLLGFIAAAAALAAGGVLAYRVPGVAFGLIAFTATNVLGGVFNPDASVLDHGQLYAPAALGAVAVPGILAKLQHRVIPGAILLVVLVCLSIVSHTRASAWRDEAALLDDLAKRCPECIEPRERLADILLTRAVNELENPAATRQFERGIRLLNDVALIEPDNPELWRHLARAILQSPSGDRGEADAALKRAQALNPKNADIALMRADIAVADWRQSDDDGALHAALDQYRIAAASGPLDARHAAQYAALLTRTGNFRQADQVLAAAQDGTRHETIERMRSQNRRSVARLDALLEEAGATSRAEQSRIAAQVHFARGDFLFAAYALERALLLDGYRYPHWELLARTRLRLGGLEQFVDQFRTDPDIPAKDWGRLAEQFREQGNTAAADLVESVAD